MQSFFWRKQLRQIPVSVRSLTRLKNDNGNPFVKTVYVCHSFDACLPLYRGFTFLTT